MLLKGKTFYSEDESVLRVIENDKEVIFTVSLENKDYENPVCWKKDAFLEGLKNGTLREVEDPLPLPTTEDLTKKQKKVRDERYAIISKYWNDPAQRLKLLHKGNEKEVYESMAKEMGVMPRTVRRIMTRFWRYGMVPDALVPHYEKRSGRQTRGDKKGPKTTAPENGRALDLKMEENFQRAYKKYYLSAGSKLSLKQCYKKMIEDNYSVESEGSRKLAERIPSYGQFYYWIRKNRDRDKERKKRKGERAYNAQDRLLTDKTITQTWGPGSRFEIDATHLNVHLVSERDPEIVVGKPLLFSVIDVYSKMIVGFSLSFENESWQSAAQAILNTAWDKTEFCRAHGIEIQEWEWPAHYLPGAFLSDNGAFKSKNAEMLTERYGVRLEYTSPWRGDLKGNIENSHKRYKDLIAMTLPGATGSKERKRGESDPRDEALLTLEDLRKIIIYITLEFNKNVITGYPLTPEMIAQDVVPSPIGLWEWGLSQGNASLKEVSDRENLKLRLLPVEERMIRRDGIHLNNLIYTGASSESLKYLERNQKRKVKIHYDPEDVTRIFVEDGELIELVLSNAYKSFRGLSLFEAERFMQIKRLNLNRSKVQSLESSINQDQNISDIIQGARKRKNERRNERLYERLKQERPAKELEEEATVQRDNGFDAFRQEFLKEKEKEDERKHQ